jgi:hypothetical protein
MRAVALAYPGDGDGFTSSPRSGSPHLASTTLRTASRNCSSDAKSFPEGVIAWAISALGDVHRGKCPNFT